jgi:hypothetical protein
MKKFNSLLHKDGVQEALWIAIGIALVAAITILA